MMNSATLPPNPYPVQAVYGKCMSILCDVSGWLVDDVPMPARGSQAKQGNSPSPLPPQEA